MKRILTLAFAVILSASLHAQTQLSLVSCSPGEDSLNMAKIRVRLDSIRKEPYFVSTLAIGGAATFWNRFTIQPSVYFGFNDSSFGMDF